MSKATFKAHKHDQQGCVKNCGTAVIFPHITLK